MRARTPAGTIDLGDAGPFVLILSPAEARPAFHRREPMCLDTLEQERSACGIVRSVGDASSRTLLLEHRHARKFARPCLRCWPELASGQLELKAGPLR
jgi:hypothetical protein